MLSAIKIMWNAFVLVQKTIWKNAGKKFYKKAKSVDNGQGVLLLTDMFGGTPSNLAMSVIGHGNFDVIAGTNLPMLIKLASARNTMSLADCVICAQEAGKKYINVASQLLNGNVK